MPQVSSSEKMIQDPVLAEFELRLRHTFYPWGYPLTIETNSHDVIQAAYEGWGAFEQAFDVAPVRLCLGVTEGGGESLPVESVIRCREDLAAIVADAQNFVMCDFDRGFAFGWVTQATAADHPLLRYRFLVSGGGMLVEQRAFAPMHGALVARNGMGVMLTGESFAGKSTLAYACARAGWTYISDDLAYLVREKDDRRAVGDPHTIRFRPDAPQFFPELADRLPTVRPNGKIAIELLTRELGLKTAACCEVGHVVCLNRGRPGPARIERVQAERISDNLAQYASYGTEEVRAAQRRSYERMLTARLWEMQYTQLDDAVARLERLVDRGA
jgi:hypothetical protein